MVQGIGESLGKALKKILITLGILLVIFVPLGIWKLVDLIHAYMHHAAK